MKIIYIHYSDETWLIKISKSSFLIKVIIFKAKEGLVLNLWYSALFYLQNISQEMPASC